VKYLLDTCVLLWALENNTDKIAGFMDIIQNPNNYIAASVVNLWEITVKKSLGKLSAPDNIVEIVEESGFSWITLDTRHVEELASLPLLHSDPFDRLLIAQAKADGYKLLTVDKEILRYKL